MKTSVVSKSNVKKHSIARNVYGVFRWQTLEQGAENESKPKCYCSLLFNKKLNDMAFIPNRIEFVR